MSMSSDVALMFDKRTDEKSSVAPSDKITENRFVITLTRERNEGGVVSTPDPFFDSNQWPNGGGGPFPDERVTLDPRGRDETLGGGRRGKGEVTVIRPAGSYRIVWRGDGGYFAQGEVSYSARSESLTLSEWSDRDNRSNFIEESQLGSLTLGIYNPDGQVLSAVQPPKEAGETLGVERRWHIPSGSIEDFASGTSITGLTDIMIKTPEGYTFRVHTDRDAQARTSRLISLEQDLPENGPIRLDEGGSLVLIKRDPLTGMELEEFFDADFYLASNPDVADEIANGEVSDPLTHFQRHGQYEGRNPNALFDTAFYLASNPDVAAGVAEGSVESAVSHFIDHGQFDWRSPNPAYSDLAYLVRNPEALDALASGEFTTPVAHFLEVGQDQGFSAVPLA